MGVLASSSRQDLEACTAAAALPQHYEWLRRPETGLVMVRGRMGGTGAPFNLGEMAVTRCTLRLDEGTVGVAHVRGRDLRHAERAALLDAALQQAQASGQLEMQWQRWIAPLERLLEQRRQQRAAEAASTQVEFFTVARGDSP
jgi:alpha-D-ribose 1-methylphosphonate 5-triphosphate synthase subunit PhnG